MQNILKMTDATRIIEPGNMNATLPYSSTIDACETINCSYLGLCDKEDELTDSR